MKFLHTMIRVKDIDASLDFYKDVMDLSVQRTMELKDATLYFLSDNEGYTQIELTYNHQQPEDGYELGTYFGHFAFETNNMEKFSEKLKSKGMDYFRPPFLIKPEGPKIAFVKDPDGYQIEIIERK